MAAKDFITRFLSDFSRWRVDQAADDLDDVSEAAGRSDRALEGVEGAARSAGRELEGMDAGKAGRGLDDVDDAARRAEGGLDDVAGAAREAEGDLGRVGEGARDAGRDVDAASDDAQTAADRIADAFRRVHRSADDDLGGIGDSARRGTHEVSEATREMGEETRAELVSMAGSFDGTFSSAADSAQALTSAIAQSLGPLGVGIGAGLALGIGLFRASAERAKETVAGLVDRMRDLQDGTASSEQVTRDYVDSLEDQGKTLRELAEDADKLGLGLDVLVRAHAGQRDALEQVATAAQAYADAYDREAAGRDRFASSADLELTTRGRLSEATRNLADNMGDAAETNRLYAAALGESGAAAEAAQERQEAYGQTLADFVDPATRYQEVLQETAQATADATKDQSDSWETYAKSTDVALDKVFDRLQKDVEDQEAWASNMSTIAARASSETVEYLRGLGTEGAPLVAKLATASDEEMARFEDLMRRRSASGVAAVAEAIDAGTAPAVLAARRQREAIAAVYSEVITQMVKVKADPASISLVRQEAAQAANGAAQGAARSRP